MVHQYLESQWQNPRLGRSESTVHDRRGGLCGLRDSRNPALSLSQHYDPDNKLWFDMAKQTADYSEVLQWIFFAVRLPFSPQARPRNQPPFAAWWALNKFTSEDIPYAKKRQLVY